MSVLYKTYLTDPQAIWYFNYLTGVWEMQGGQGGAAAVELYAYQPSSLSTLPLTLDASGNLMVTGGGGGSGSNAAAGPTGSAVPSSGDYTAWNSGGNLVGVALTNPLPVQPGTGATFPVSGTVAVSNFPATQPVSAAALPLPSGAATAAGVAAVVTALGSPLQAGGSVSVSNFPATQAVSGTVTANQGAPPWTVKPDGTGWTLTGTAANVNMVNASIAVTGTFWQATQPISAASLPLPAGAATSALQTTINTTLGTPMQQTGGSLSVTNFPATQAVSAASLPLPANAAQETGGNLATMVTLLTYIQKSVDLQTQILAVLQAIRLQEASAFGQSVEPDTLIPDPTFN